MDRTPASKSSAVIIDLLLSTTRSHEAGGTFVFCLQHTREPQACCPFLQCPDGPPTRGSRWMTAGLVQDADLVTGTVARVVTKPLLSCQPRVRAVHLLIDPSPTS